MQRMWKRRNCRREVRKGRKKKKRVEGNGERQKKMKTRGTEMQRRRSSNQRPCGRVS